jgi:hypothetical protein
MFVHHPILRNVDDNETPLNEINRLTRWVEQTIQPELSMIIANNQFQHVPLVITDIDFIISRFVILQSEIDRFRFREEELTQQRRNMYREDQLDELDGMIFTSITFLDVIARIFEDARVRNN